MHSCVTAEGIQPRRGTGLGEDESAAARGGRRRIQGPQRFFTQKQNEIQKTVKTAVNKSGRGSYAWNRITQCGSPTTATFAAHPSPHSVGKGILELGVRMTQSWSRARHSVSSRDRTFPDTTITT